MNAKERRVAKVAEMNQIKEAIVAGIELGDQFSKVYDRATAVEMMLGRFGFRIVRKRTTPNADEAADLSEGQER